MRQTSLLRALLLSFALTSVVTVACKRDSAQAQIERALEGAVTALGSRDAKAAGAILSDDFVDDAKRTRQDLVRLGFFALQRGPLFVRLQSIETEVSGETARSQVTVLAVQASGDITSAADLLSSNARSFDLTLSWRKQGGDWRVTRVVGLPRLSLE